MFQVAFMKKYFQGNLGKWCFWESLGILFEMVTSKRPLSLQKSKFIAFKMKLIWLGPSVSFQAEPRALDIHFCIPYLPCSRLPGTRLPESLPHPCSTIPGTLNLNQFRLPTMTFYLLTLLLWVSSFPCNANLCPLHLANPSLLPGFTSDYVPMWKI